MPNEGRVYFGLFGDDFNPESLSIGISPTRTARKGSPIPKQSSWIYSSERIQSDLIDVYEMSSALVTALSPHAQQIREAMKKHNLEAVLEVVLTITPDDSVSTPAVGFDSAVISFLHEVGASIDVDIYRGES
jgi:hypothetical protein